ncbi:hypothetical protein XENTR_v10023157 [Xenopus tropicalis]|nr:hypothetical protein XENTR_v10023157 [Xenopus tropicalis]
MWEEASDPVMGKKDKNEERKERILNLTLEIIYLLTGEGYVIPKKKSPTVGLGALHAPGSVIQKENDKKILELISNIIQLLTGEVAIRCEDVSIYFSLEEWEYIKGNKALYREGIKEEEEPQQLRPLAACEYKDGSDVTAHTEATLCCNNDGNLTNPDVSPAEQPPPANGIKEEAASWEGGNQSDCSINPLTEQIQGTDTPTPIMGCSLNSSSAANYISDDADEGGASCEEGNLSDYRIITVSEQVQETDTVSVIMGCSLNDSLVDNYISVVIAEEPVRWEQGNQSDCSINPLTEQIQGTDTPTPIMGGSLGNSSAQSYCHKNNGHLMACNCPECQTEPHRNTDLRNHKGTAQKPFACYICGKSFIRRSVLAVHQRTHTGEKPYACSECGKCFAHQSDLNRHQKSHTGYKPFSCNDCGKCFTRRWYLNVHRKIHTKEKPFTCSECGKGFTQLSNLNYHYRIHTGEQHYICSACGQSFQTCLALIEHQRSHTGQTSFLL